MCILELLSPNSVPAQGLKMLTRDHERLMRPENAGVLNQIGITLKEYYPRLEFLAFWRARSRAIFSKYPPRRLSRRLNRRGWNRFAQRDHHLSEARSNELWEKLGKTQLPIPDHVVRAKAKLLLALVVQLEALLPEVDSYSEEVERFFCLYAGS